MALVRYRIKEGWDYFDQIDFFFQSFAVYRNDINDLIERQVETASENYTDFLAKRVAENDFHPDAEWFQHHIAVNVATNLKDIYYDSLIIVLYSFLERKLSFLCTYLEKDYPIKIDDISGKGIFKYRKYLSKVAGISFDNVENEWKELEKLNRLRNHLVHASGSRTVANNNKALLSILKSIQGVHVEEAERDQLRFHFITDHGIGQFVQMVRTILDHVYCTEV
jgi:hypothetical protein